MNELFGRYTSSPVNRIDTRLKIMISLCLSVLVVLIDAPLMLSLLAMCGTLFLICSRPSPNQLKLLLITVVPLAWGMMVSQAIFYNRFPRYVICELLAPNWFFKDGLRIYTQGVYHGLIQSLRMITMVCTGYAICFSTSPDSFLRGLTALRVPFGISFMATTAIRFAPVVFSELQSVRAALKLKGYQPMKNGILDFIRVEVSSLRPVLAATIRRSEDISLSILTRGFTIDGQRTCLHASTFGAKSWIFVIAMFLTVMFVFFCKALFWLYQQGIFYSPLLRRLYGFCREWL